MWWQNNDRGKMSRHNVEKAGQGQTDNELMRGVPFWNGQKPLSPTVQLWPGLTEFQLCSGHLISSHIYTLYLTPFYHFSFTIYIVQTVNNGHNYGPISNRSYRHCPSKQVKIGRRRGDDVWRLCGTFGKKIIGTKTVSRVTIIICHHHLSSNSEEIVHRITNISSNHAAPYFRKET